MIFSWSAHKMIWSEEDSRYAGDMKLWSYDINFASFKIVEGCVVKKKTPETWTALFTRQKHKCLSHGINMELEFWVSMPFPYQMSACLEGVWSNCMGV